ncbi:MAG: UDP-3-O-acyl-N-acetylglucosamine deacetylase, partial [Alphaproteobacteria bacterium]|nr:UDP-3-O-acyl-N-acetylglucosamine deacetylase [Alphaproteobacteria bacterium]
MKMFFRLRSEATIRDKVEFTGVGVHSGRQTKIRVLPATEGNGIVFKRTDIKSNRAIV